jgi:hypothetical protein
MCLTLKAIKATFRIEHTILQQNGLEQYFKHASFSDLLHTVCFNHVYLFQTLLETFNNVFNRLEHLNIFHDNICSIVSYVQ